MKSHGKKATVLLRMLSMREQMSWQMKVSGKIDWAEIDVNDKLYLASAERLFEEICADWRKDIPAPYTLDEEKVADLLIQRIIEFETNERKPLTK